MSAAALARFSNFQNYLQGPQRILKYLGLNITQKANTRSKCIQIVVMVNILMMTLLQIIYNITSTDEQTKKLASISYLNYHIVGLGKTIAIYFNDQALTQSLAELEKIFPKKRMERYYFLEHYLRRYLWVEYLVWNFFRFICVFYLVLPFVQSLMQLIAGGEFPFMLPIFLWTFVPLQESIAEYVLFYILSSVSSFTVGCTITGCDLCLFSMVTQLSLQFDLMARKIMELKPENEMEALKQLNAIARYHRDVVTLAQKINNLFIPSILFSLFSSTFILCFCAFQMLGDVTFFIMIKSFLLLMYEGKQVILTCYFGNKLIECSSLVHESLYMHNWVDGSVRYKKQLLFMLMATRKPFTLNAAGIVGISLVTLKQVYGNAYQVFTVLKSK